ncbi:uncharacterized protein LOC122975421 [Thunnus albacares]|uniref:uncharacterized protein LOC122975421 n=1 Tax=Thunnus albacares TaxID=8236 RepID=UPI001CF6A20C|nr:uncharacterized protein LOC122975421 [Thunnus albacares]
MCCCVLLFVVVFFDLLLCFPICRCDVHFRATVLNLQNNQTPAVSSYDIRSFIEHTTHGEKMFKCASPPSLSCTSPLSLSCNHPVPVHLKSWSHWSLGSCAAVSSGSRVPVVPAFPGRPDLHFPKLQWCRPQSLQQHPQWLCPLRGPSFAFPVGLQPDLQRGSTFAFPFPVGLESDFQRVSAFAAGLQPNLRSSSSCSFTLQSDLCHLSCTLVALLSDFCCLSCTLVVLLSDLCRLQPSAIAPALRLPG